MIRDTQNLCGYQFRTEDYSKGQLWHRTVIPAGDETATRRYNDYNELVVLSRAYDEWVVRMGSTIASWMCPKPLTYD